MSPLTIVGIPYLVRLPGGGDCGGRCIYLNMTPDVSTSDCSQMYIHNVYHMLPNVYRGLYICFKDVIHLVTWYIHLNEFLYTSQVQIG